MQIRNPQFAIRNSSWKGSLTGKAVVLKTTAHLSLAGSTPVPSANSCPTTFSLSLTLHGKTLAREHDKLKLVGQWRRRLTVWQRFAKSPRIACAGSSSVASANLFGPVAQRIGERDSAQVEGARSNRARSRNIADFQLQISN